MAFDEQRGVKDKTKGVRMIDLDTIVLKPSLMSLTALRTGANQKTFKKRSRMRQAMSGASS